MSTSTIQFGAWFRHREPPRSLLIRYGSALSVVVAAIGLRLWLDPLLERAGFAISLTGMLTAAWLGGIGPSLISQTLILFAEALWFNPTHEVHSPATARGIVSLIAFYFVGVIVAALSEAWQSARKRALAEKNEAIGQREQLRATLACVGDGVLVADSQGRLTLMNPVAETMTGWTFAESKGKPARDVFAICDELEQKPIENPVQRVLRDGHVLHETMRLILTTRNNHHLPVAFSASPIHDARGKTTGVVLIFRDETQRRRAEKALRRADQRKNEFLAMLAHELRNPLAPICMGLELMNMTDDREEAREVRSMMQRQTQHMVRLIDDLLDVSRITRGKLELRRCQVRLDDAVRNAIDATRPAIDDAGHQLTVTLPDKPILLDADPNRLTQILSNLLSNAAKYTPKGGRVELTARESGAEVAVTVADNGRGIPPEMLEQIFEMFTQAHGPSETDQRGLGIGLTLVKRLVELHGGTVEVESAGENLGSRFCVRLPAMRLPTVAKATSTKRRARRQPKGVSRRVLIVDDNVDALTSMTMLVRVMGHVVDEARDGLEAIEVAERFRPEIVLMDIGMPKLNGYEAAQRIRAAEWGTDVVLVATTGWGQEEDRRRTVDAGFDRHLVKPVDANVLEQLLAESTPGSGGTRMPTESHSPELAFAGALAQANQDDAEVTSAIGSEYRETKLPK